MPRDDGTLDFSVSDPQFDTSNLDCSIDKEVLRDLFMAIRDGYKQVIANETESEGYKFMKLNISKTIDENIIGVDISVAELGTSDTDAATEKDMLHNFVRTIEYSKISFKSNMKADSNGDPVTTDSEVDDSTIISVELKDIINQSFVVDENLHITFSVDVTKIPESEVKAPFDSVEKLGKAKVELFATKIQEEIGKKLAEIRALNTKFEGKTEVIL